MSNLAGFLISPQTGGSQGSSFLSLPLSGAGAPGASGFEGAGGIFADLLSQASQSPVVAAALEGAQNTTQSLSALLSLINPDAAQHPDQPFAVDLDMLAQITGDAGKPLDGTALGSLLGLITDGLPAATIDTDTDGNDQPDGDFVLTAPGIDAQTATVAALSPPVNLAGETAGAPQTLSEAPIGATGTTPTAPALPGNGTAAQDAETGNAPAPSAATGEDGTAPQQKAGAIQAQTAQQAAAAPGSDTTAPAHNQAGATGQTGLAGQVAQAQLEVQKPDGNTAIQPAGDSDSDKPAAAPDRPAAAGLTKAADKAAAQAQERIERNIARHSATTMPEQGKVSVETAAKGDFTTLLQTSASSDPGQSVRITATPQQIAANQLPIATMAVQIAGQFRAGIQRFSIRMDPPELGRIDVRLEVGHDGSVASRLTVERSETLDMLMRDSKALERALNDAGLKTDQGSLQFSLKGQGFAQQQGGGNGTPRDLPGHISAQEQADLEAPVAQARFSARSGVDIVV